MNSEWSGGGDEGRGDVEMTKIEGYWELTESYLDKRADSGLITPAIRGDIIDVSKCRHPERRAERIEMTWLNQTKTLRLQSIHNHGGEKQGDPFLWLAEIVTFTESELKKIFQDDGLQLCDSSY